MPHPATSKLLLRLSFLAGLILLLLPNLFGWINEELIHTFGDYLGYRMLLSLIVLLFLALVYQHFSHRLMNLEGSHPKQSTAESQDDDVDEEALRGNLEKRLHNLSDDEKALLRQYIDGNTKTKRFDLTHATAMALASQGILYRPVPQIALYGLVTYALQPWAWEYLKKNTHLLD